MKDQKPDYYVIIPAKIRYAEDLSAQQKLFRGELAALSNKYGYCFASNSYIASKYGKKSPKRVSTALNDMVKKKYLRVEIDKDGGNMRKIFIMNFKSLMKHANPIPEIHTTPITEKRDSIMEIQDRAIPEIHTTLSLKNETIIIQDNNTSVNNNEAPPQKNFFVAMQRVDKEGDEWMKIWNVLTGRKDSLDEKLRTSLGLYIINNRKEEFSKKIQNFVKIRDLITKKKAQALFYYPVRERGISEFLEKHNYFYGDESIIICKIAKGEEKNKAVKLLKNAPPEIKKEEKKADPINKEEVKKILAEARSKLGSKN